MQINTVSGATSVPSVTFSFNIRRLAVIAALAASGQVSATYNSEPEPPYVPTTTLGQIGVTENQQRTGDTVQTVCGELGLLGSRTALQQDLFDRCGSMVGNASVLLSAGHPAEPKTLGLTSEAELAAVVQTVANEELAATKSMATEMGSTAANAAIGRLGALRGGVRLGATLNNIEVFGNVADDSSPNHQYGGSAGDALNGAWGVFVNAKLGTGDRDGTSQENAFDYDTYGLTVGGDYRVDDNNIVGAMLGYNNIDADFDSNSNFANAPSGTPGGSVESDGWFVGIYGTHYTERGYFDGLISYGQSDYDIRREIVLAGPAVAPITRTARADTDGNTFTFSLGGGMDMQSGSMSYGPYARMTYQRTEVDGYSESGAQGLNLTVADQDWTSLTSNIGVRASNTYSQDWGILTPHVGLGWIHEFQNDSQQITAFYTVDPNQNNLIAVTDNPDENYFELNLGVSAVMRSGTQAFFDYQTLLGHRNVTDHSITIGFRTEL